jgi:glycosyltransferase involved in cell wall biosynthesis
MLSFIVPAYNEEHELPRALASIRLAAEAAPQPFEIIVVDDGSTDATAEIARAAGAVVVPVHFRQIAAVRNAGARAAQGDVLFFVDADTWISPTHVADALTALKAGCAGGGARVVCEGVPLWGRIFVQVFSALYFVLSNLGAGAFLFTTRENFHAIGGFDEELFAGEEVYFTVALKKLGRFKLLREPIVTSGRKLRMHSAGFILRRSFSLLLGGRRGVSSRDKLDLWYDGKRETKAVAPIPVRAPSSRPIPIVAIGCVLAATIGPAANASEENPNSVTEKYASEHRAESAEQRKRNVHDSVSIGKLIDDINAAVRSNKHRMLSIITINTDVATSQLEEEKARTGMTFGDVYVAHSLAFATKKKFKDIVALHKAGQTWAQIAKSHNVSLKGSSELIEQMKKQQ